jgi:single-strand DNA-binding protein
MAVNKVILVGNVGKDPDVRTLTSGSKVASFSLATTDAWKDKNTQERKEKTEWHKIVVYNSGLVTIVENYVKKGVKLYVEGALQTRKWTNQAGEERYATEVVLQGFGANLQILSDRNGEGRKQGGTTNSDEAMPSDDYLSNDKIDDDIPF